MTGWYVAAALYALGFVMSYGGLVVDDDPTIPAAHKLALSLCWPIVALIVTIAGVAGRKS
jgi:hypothetical protein